MRFSIQNLKALMAALTATALAQAVLIYWGFHSVGTPIGDLDFAYRPWIHNMVTGHYILGINHPWVYPVLALVPIYAAWMIGHVHHFVTGWYIVEVAFQLIAVSIFMKFGRASARLVLVFWYLAFMILLGPVSVSRLESFAVPLALMALGQLLDGKSGVIHSTINALIKVWPVVFIASIITTAKDRLRQLLWALSISLGIVLAALAIGGNLADIFSFLSDQAKRNTQVESIFALPSLWYGAMSHTQPVQYNPVMLTLEVHGKYSHLGQVLSAPLLILSLSLAIALAYLAAKKSTSVIQVTALLSFNLALALIAFNKVGSPQYIDWLIVPVLFVAATRCDFSKLYLGAMAVISGLTAIIYPEIYGQILTEQPLGLSVLTLRNLLVLALWVFTSVQLARLAIRGSRSTDQTRI